MSELTKISPSLEHVDTCVPITALKTFEWGQKLFIFQGQGPFFRIIDDQTGDVVAQIQGFRRNNVHGFILLPQSEDGRVRVLIWGGPSVRAIELVFDNGPEHTIALSAVTSEFLAPDWILNGCAAVPGGSNSVYLITANNALLGLKFRQDASGVYSESLCLRQLTTSVKSILYTGDLVALSASHILVVSGTAFGEIIVWSCFINDEYTSKPEAIGSIHHFFTGHEGSIYGVRILPKIQSLNGGQSGRLLASCSDDRTIRIWDISDCENKSAKDQSAYSTDGFELRSTGFGSTATEHSEVGSESCVAKAYGHAARIWAVKSRSMREETPNKLGLVTRGEDCACVEWDLDWETSTPGSTKFSLRQTSTIHPHSGKHIWAMDLCSQGEETVVFTGGADGALKSYRIREINCPKKPDPPVNLKLARLHGPKSFALVAPDCFLCCSVRSELQLGFLGPEQYAKITWENLCILEDLKSFAVMTGMPSLGLALIGNSKGLVRLYNHKSRSFSDLVDLGERALLFFCLESSLRSGSFSFLATYLKDEKATLVTVNDWEDANPRVESTTFALPRKPFDISSTAMTNNGQYLIIGSKIGGLAVYRVAGLNSSSEPLAMDRRAHGKEGTHHIQELPNYENQSSSSHFILTCGRDGHYCVHEIKATEDGDGKLSLETLHRSSSALGSHLQGAYFDEETQDLMIFGYNGQTFVLRNESKQTDIGHIPSGGFRRTWAFHPGTKGCGKALFMFQEGAQILAVRIQMDSQRSVRSGGHGREIKSMDCRNPDLKIPSLFATGAEDTTLRIMSPSNNATKAPWGSFRTHLILKTHNSGIQQVTWSKNGRYLFTSAADEELFIWKVGSLPSFGATAVLFATCPKTEVDSELRVTSFDVVEVGGSGSEEGFLLCLTLSNSRIRIFHFSPSDGGRFTQLAQGQYMTNCLTQARFLVKDSSVSLITAATDGYFTLWDLTSTLEPFYTITSSTLKLKTSLESSSISPESITCENRYHANSNSIKTMELVHISDSFTILLTGSDDNSITVSLLKTSPTNPCRNAEVATVSIPDAHTASVTTLQIISQEINRDPSSGSETTNLTVASSGNDHRVKLWSITVDPAQGGTEGIKIEFLLDRYSAVADISSLGVLKDAVSSEKQLLIGGVGLELLQLKSR